MLNCVCLFLTCTLFSVIALFDAGCSRQAGKERALARADAYYLSGTLDKAEVEYLNTLKADPKNARAIAQLGLIYSEQGRIGKAPSFLMKARELQPDNLEIRTKLAVFFLAAKKKEEARAEFQYILEHQPDHPEAPLLLAECAQQPKDMAEVKAFLQKLPTAQTAPVLTALASLEFHQRKIPEAEILLKQAQALDAKSPAVNISLGMLYLAQNNLKAAEDAYATAWLNSPARSPRKLVYIRFKLQTGDAESARRLLTELTTQAPDSLPPLILLAELDGQQKKYDEALTLINKVLERDPNHYPAMILSARLRLAKGETDKALSTLEKMSSLQPKNPEIRYQIGLTYLAQGDAGKATASFNQAVDLAPGYVDAILQLAELNLKKGEAKAASAALKSLVTQRPDLVPAKFLLARAYVSQGELDEALSIYQEVAAASPRDANFLLPIALIYRQQKKYDEARKVLAKALELSPDSGPVVEQLVDLDLMAGEAAAARRRVEALQSRQPVNAMPHLLFAKIDLATKDLTQAEAELIKVIELQPDTYAAYYLLAGIYSQTSQDTKALAQLERLALQNPNNAALLMRIALLQERLNESTAARDTYEKILTLKPGFIPALNNLAYLLSKQPDTLKRGLSMAQKAHELAPFDPNIADTLGWILYQQGQYQRAHILLRESATKLPDDPAVQLHLGLAQYMMGEMKSARLTLLRALQLNPQLSEKNLINLRLAILGTDDTPSGPEQRATLEKAVASDQNDPVALTRLGQLLEKAGEIDQAQKKLNAALAINPYNVSAALSLIRVHLARHETNRALDLAKATRKQAPDDPLVSQQLGRIAFQIGEYQWAASLLQESSRKLPDDRELLFDHAKAAYSIGQVSEAEEIMRHILQDKPPFPAAAAVSSYLEMIALMNHPRADSFAKIEQSLQADPAFVPALMASGARAEFQSDIPAARQAYEKALTQYPEFTPAKRSLALLAASTEDNETRGYELAVQAREAFPNDPAVAQALGILSYRKGNFSRAASLLKESLSRQGEDARQTFYLGMALYRLNDPTAKTTLQRSLELGIKDEAAIEARQTIAKMQ